MGKDAEGGVARQSQGQFWLPHRSPPILTNQPTKNKPIPTLFNVTQPKHKPNPNRELPICWHQKIDLGYRLTSGGAKIFKPPKKVYFKSYLKP